ncbi:ABC transporter substrate-binding protein [Nocardioides coralli]|uniref:ABC transporter substrate-binding protein n=1 Tax=Nocardioides coralli TaxID=2872154 RepID=UPI001CA40268|nr:extracellular solute-binding protein [Nocardioides coralli]QZY29768.1 extracellular solute-binding protein [Nocardioides coralli]
MQRRARRAPGSGRRLLAAVVLAALVATACQAEGGPEPDPPPGSAEPTTASPTPDTELTFAVFGTGREVDAYESLVSVYNSLYDRAEMSIESYDSRREFIAAVRTTGQVPDVFLTAGRDLAWLQERQLVQPVDNLLIERGVDFGDLYSRDAVLAFSNEGRLQCMPVGISPMVIYYNTELVDFDRMEQRGLPVPEEERLTWSFEEFVAALEYASRPRRGTRGIQVEPTLEALSPFIYAAGGEIYDDPSDPTSLSFSDDATRAALETVLPVLRDPRLTLSDEQLERRSPLEWFQAGKLAMLPGYRDLTPTLREQPGLRFDTIAMPSIERSATVGDISGMCVSAETDNLTAAADFLVHMTSPVSVRRVAAEGYLVPANLEVAVGPGFRQPGLAPAHAAVFTNALRTIVLPPQLTSKEALEEALSESLDQLLTAPVLADLEGLTARIDERSREVLDPEGLAEEESPAETESP